ncbi:MAG: metallophosphoesterase [Gammaproteobacteria bacterium]|nr:metallophosphoesterase [Gammaproteobacteria bacterium]
MNDEMTTVSSSDEPSWDLGDRDCIFAIGDVHGDLDALVRILIGLGIVDAAGNWAGGSANLILMGDINDRGADSVNAIAFVMMLQQDAPLQGGAVHALLGNHELLVAQGDFRYVAAREVLALERFWYDDVDGLHAIYRGNSPFAQWIRQRPTILKSGTTVFVHAGLDERVVGIRPEVMNATLKSWVAHFQGAGEAPDDGSMWLTSEEGRGPLWSKGFRVSTACAPSDSDRDRSKLREWLGLLGGKRLVVGHRPTKALGYDIALPHPTFGDLVTAIDTGISRFYGGRLSALEIRGGELRPRYFDRGNSDLVLTQTLRQKYHSEREAISGGKSIAA